MPLPPETRRGTSFFLWGSVLAAALLVVVAVRYLTRERVTIRTAQVSYQALTKTSSTNGKVEPVDQFEAHALNPGIVQEIYVRVGQKVKAGQLLIKMDDTDARARLASAQSALQAAELAHSDILQGGTQDERNTYTADLERARLQRQQDASALASLQQLQQRGAASAAEISSIQQRLQVDEANLRGIQQHSTQRYGTADRARSEAQIADARAALAAAQKSVASVNIHTPLSGTVFAIPVTQYDYVPAGEGNDLIYVADLNRLQITAYFDEPEVGNLAIGQPVTIVWDAKPGRIWHGHISIAPTSIIAYNTRNVGECFITVDDASGDLEPNANVTVTVTTAQHQHVLSVPREALHTDGPQTYVYRIQNGRLVRTPVIVGIVNQVRVEIVSGLAEGDIVATTPAATNRELSGGLEVTPVQ